MLVPHSILAIFDVGGPEIMMIMLVVLLLFGSDRLPGLARSMGKSIREFKKATSGLEEELKRALEAPPQPKARPPERKPATPASERPAPAPPVEPPPTSSPPPEDPPFSYP